MGVGASEPSRRLRIPSHIRARPRAPAASLPPFPVQTATGQEEPRQGGDQLRGDQRGRPAQRGPAVDDQVVDRRENHEVIQQSKWRGPAGQPVWEAAIPPGPAARRRALADACGQVAVRARLRDGQRCLPWTGEAGRGGRAAAQRPTPPGLWGLVAPPWTARGGSPSPPSREARTSLSTSLGCGRHGAAEVLGSRVLGVQPLRAIVPRSRRPRPQPCLLRARWRSSLHLAAEHSICGRYSLCQGEGGEPRTPAQQPPGRRRPPHCLLLAPFALLCSVATDGHLRPASGFNGVLAVMQDSSGLWLGQHGAVTVCWHSHSGGLTLPTGSRSIVAE